MQEKKDSFEVGDFVYLNTPMQHDIGVIIGKSQDTPAVFTMTSWNMSENGDMRHATGEEMMTMFKTIPYLAWEFAHYLEEEILDLIVHETDNTAIDAYHEVLKVVWKLLQRPTQPEEFLNGKLGVMSNGLGSELDPEVTSSGDVASKSAIEAEKSLNIAKKSTTSRKPKSKGGKSRTKKSKP